jgi:hypothetical protein
VRNENPRISRFTATVVLLTILWSAVQKLPAQTRDVNPTKAGNEAMKMTDTPSGFYCHTKALNPRENATTSSRACWRTRGWKPRNFQTGMHFD